MLTELKKTYTFDYPEAVKFTEQQMSVFWMPDEIHVEKDIQDIRTNMTESEQHGVITVLKLFTLYELEIGKEYWGNKVMKWFPRPEVERMANCFSFFELNVHAPFYNNLNKALGLDTDDFYSSYLDDPDLLSRISFIASALDSDDRLLSLSTFSILEGAVLYSNFAFLKHFQAQGKNKLKNVVSGIDFSVRDENLHSLAGAWLFKTHAKESGKEIPVEEIKSVARLIEQHESIIIDKIFEKGTMEGITSLQLKHFVQSRVNLCLENLGIEPIFPVIYNPIASWFYRSINDYKYNDFFNGLGREYNRSWSEQRFTW